MIVPSQLALKTRTNFGCAASLATLDKLIDRFPLPPPIGDASFTHVMRLAAHSTTSPTPNAMGRLFIMTLYLQKGCSSIYFSVDLEIPMELKNIVKGINSLTGFRGRVRSTLVLFYEEQDKHIMLLNSDVKIYKRYFKCQFFQET
jgi:hypothetical protein